MADLDRGAVPRSRARGRRSTCRASPRSLESERGAASVGAVARLDKRRWIRTPGLRDPGGNSSRPRLRPRAARASPTCSQRFQLFHTPPATPIAAAREARKDDPRIEAPWLEYQRAELPKKRRHRKRARLPPDRRRDGILPDAAAAARPRRRSDARSPASFSRQRPRTLSVKVAFPAGTLQVPRTVGRRAR